MRVTDHIPKGDIMSYNMCCDRCGKPLKLGDKVVTPYSVVTVKPADARERSLRWCDECTNTELERADEVQRRIDEKITRALD